MEEPPFAFEDFYLDLRSHFSSNHEEYCDFKACLGLEEKLK